ncbi:GNAT family N-acetyltransferase [Stakelama saccharophila]|uniref:GNAT family N-acetyltransferase n=1 Tax=Stakelama saccharophila TaxID=3075605 RepID=A0ABZ0B547_9SPHN|nr:GNAT family N-acetyltransferase [Stakelama sp. W311]WNO52505.1 GNAT family N-acetyltransferase [Stakelama sp. W311]
MSADPVFALRRAAAGDAAALSLVASATFLDTFAGILDGSDIVAHCAANNAPLKFEAWFADPGSVITVAEAGEGGAPVGYTVLTSPDLPLETGPEDVELKRIYVLSRLHGSGVGRALMNRAFDDARKLGRRRVLLGVYGRNDRARAFYERHGFRLVGERRFLVGKTWHEDVVYARSL